MLGEAEGALDVPSIVVVAVTLGGMLVISISLKLDDATEVMFVSLSL